MKHSIIAASIICIALSACGGGGDSGASTPVVATPVKTSPDGLYTGKTNTGRAFTGLILDDGSYYVLYSSPTDTSSITGLVQGTGSSLNGSFTSTNGKDFGFQDGTITPVNLSASYVVGATFNGSVAASSLNQTQTFTSTYDKRYEVAPSLATIAGSYTGTGVAQYSTVTVSASGSINAKDVDGCALSGTVTPRAVGNVYNVSITSGGAGCLLPNTKLNGVAYFDTSTKMLYAVVLNDARTDGYYFNGPKN